MRSLSSGAHSRDPLALPALRILRTFRRPIPQCHPGCCIRARVCANSSSLLSISERLIAISWSWRSSSLCRATRAAWRSWRAITDAMKRLMRRRRCAGQSAGLQANGLVAEVGMVLSIVMAIFFQRVAGTRRSCRPPFYRRPAASMVSAGFGAATSTGHGCVMDPNKQAMHRNAGRASPPATQGAARQATFRPAARSLTASVVTG